MTGSESLERPLGLPYSWVTYGGLDRAGSASTSVAALNAQVSEVKHQGPNPFSAADVLR